MKHSAKLTAAVLTAVLAALTGGAAVHAAAAEDEPAQTQENSASAETSSKEEETTEAAEEAPSGAWEMHSGKHYYRLADGKYASGETDVDGVTYLFGVNGALKTGWQTVGGERVYFDPTTGAPAFGWLDYFGSRYYIGGEGKLSGWAELDGNAFYFSPETGAALSGLQEIDGSLYYFTEDSGAVKGVYNVDGIDLPFDAETGVLKDGWYTVEETTRYFSRTAMSALSDGFAEIDGDTYYFGQDGSVYTGLLVLNGDRYYFDEDGKMVRGWMTQDGFSYYYDEEGKGVSGLVQFEDGLCGFDGRGAQYLGWAELDGKLYYFDTATGYALSGWQSIDGDTYYIDPETYHVATGLIQTEDGLCGFNESGAQYHGWAEMDGEWYYFGEDGYALTGWQTIGDFTYYIDPETVHLTVGLMQTEEGIYGFDGSGAQCFGAAEIDGALYCFGEDGTAQTGWFTDEEGTYYFDPDTLTAHVGLMQTESGLYGFGEDGRTLYGAVNVDGGRYFFGEDGMAQIEWQSDGVNTYYADPETYQLYTGLVETGRGIYCFDENTGAQKLGWKSYGGEMYYFAEDGAAVTDGQYTVEGKTATFSASGIVTSDTRLYNQKDSKWKNIYYTKYTRTSNSLYTSGCGMFSFCNALFWLNGTQADVGEVANWAVANGSFQPGLSGTLRTPFYNSVEGAFGERFGFRVGAQIWGGISDSRLKNHLMSGGTAVVHVYNHFMAVTAYNPNTGLFRVLDSMVSTTRNLPGDSWQTASKMSSGKTNVDWFVLLYNRT